MTHEMGKVAAKSYTKPDLKALVSGYLTQFAKSTHVQDLNFKF